MIESFINKLGSQFWSIDKARGRSAIAAIIQRLRSARPARDETFLKNDRPAEDLWGEPLPKMQIVGDVAVIPVRGMMALALPQWIKSWGLNMTDINDVTEEIALALGDARVRFIVLDFDSPGGWSLAGNKLFDVVEKSQAGKSGKPIFSWCPDGGDVCSAAFQAASPSRMFLTGPYAMAVGCIGTLWTLYDDTKFWEMMGIDIKVLRSGEMKGAGVDGYSEEQISWMQSTVDQFGARFRANVSKYRTMLEPAEMQGQYYDGAQAARLGFTHGTAVDLNAALVKFRRQL